MSSYASSYPPNTDFNPAYKKFFEEFYQISDSPDAHEKYVAQFTPNATLIMASKICSGSSEILALRHQMWTKVSSRKHKALKIFPFGPNSSEVMLYGTVDYVLKEGGKEISVDWAARAKLVMGYEEPGNVRMEFYQVYLDTAAQAPKN